MTYRLLAAVAVLALAPAANAQVIFSENFDNQGTVGASDLNFAGFTKFTVAGAVDLVRGGDFGITCSGKCVDLDGSPGPGTITSQAIGFAANQRLLISFDVSGSQRSTDSDPFSFKLSFTSGTGVSNAVSSGGFLGGLNGNFPSLSSFTYSSTILGAQPFASYLLAFTPTNAGSFTLGFGTTSNDNAGPLLDNVNVSVVNAAVPEPASWGLMILGFGMAGMALRRRTARVATA